MGEGDGDVGEDDGGVGVDRGDDDGPGGVPAPPGERGREPPFFFFFFFFLDLLPRWEKGFPSGPWLPWRGRGESHSDKLPFGLSHGWTRCELVTSTTYAAGTPSGPSSSL